MARSLEGETLQHVVQTGPGMYAGDYRGYSLNWQRSACDIWKGRDFIQTVRGHNELGDAFDLIDSWMLADDGR